MDRERVEIELGLMLADMNNGALTINRFAIRVDCLMRAILTDTPDDDGWIDWRGGKCPVADGTRLDIELRDGDTATNIDAPEELIWDFDDEESSGDIIRSTIRRFPPRQYP